MIMKKITTLMSLLAMTMFVSCTKENSGSTPENQSVDKAFVQVTISDASVTGRASDGDRVEATQDESTVNNVALLAFDEHHNYIAAYLEGTYTTNASGQSIYTATIAPTAKYFCVFVNYNDDIRAMISSLSGIGNDTSKLYEEYATTAAEAAESGNFMMATAGSMANEVDNPYVTFTDAELSTDETAPTKITIPVDRLVSKFTCSVASSYNTDSEYGLSEVLGVKLNATNKVTYPYSQILLNDLTGDNVYRKDPNMTVGNDIADLAVFNWLKNTQTVVDSFIAMDEIEYCLENTANGAYYNYNNLTQAVVKAEFLPTSLKSELSQGDSWFAINIALQGTTYFTFDGVKAYYASLTPSTGEATDENKAIIAAMDRQLNHILGTDASATQRTWGDADLYITDLDAIECGGYVAATVDDEADYIVQYYQNSLNYYDIFIQHDENKDVDNLGRWGMVRNNSYSLSVSGLTGTGLPYIPDPTDPEIVDPQNPDPTDPEPADGQHGYIEATIDVNDWVFWSQSTELN